MGYLGSEITIHSIPVQRSRKRKRIAIQLQVNGQLKILAPAAASEAELQNALNKFKPWLQKKLTQLATLPESERCFGFNFNIGGNFFLFGQLYELKYQSAPAPRQIIFRDNALWSNCNEPLLLPAMLEKFYRRQARQFITSRLEIFTRQFNISIGKMKISGARRRFGSCNSKGDLNFSWHLAMYPTELVDLVILHELAHRSEMNHSGRFYQVLASYLPDHLERNQKLKFWSRKLAAYPA